MANAFWWGFILSADRDETSDQWRQLLDNTPQLVGLATAFSVIFSAIYNVGYFSELGFLRSDILTISDVVMTAFQWMPLAIVFAFSITLRTAMARPRIKAPNDGQTTTNATARVRIFAAVLFSVGMFILATFFLFEQTNEFLSVVMAILSVWFGLGVFAATRVAHRIGVPVAMMFLVIPMTLFFAVQSSVAAARADIASRDYRTTVWLDNGQFNAVLFRNLERGLLLRRQDNRKLIFVARDHVLRIEQDDRPMEKTRICAWSGLFCDIRS